MRNRKIDTKQQKYFVNGMHCESCQILLKNNIEENFKDVKVTASLKERSVNLRYNGNPPSVEELDRIFKSDGYTFSDKKSNKERELFSYDKGRLFVDREKFISLFYALLILLIGYLSFKYLSELEIFKTISSKFSSSPTYLFFFTYGLIAGASSCAALVGGLLLSVSSKGSELYLHEKSVLNQLKPFVQFNIGRIISFVILGAILGGLGMVLGESGNFILSRSFTATMTILVSIFMLYQGLQLAGYRLKVIENIQESLSDRYSIFNSDSFKGKWAPFIVGSLTFFVPCGLTFGAQLVAFSTLNSIVSGLSLGFFALGTLPFLALVSFTSYTMSSKPRFKNTFNYLATTLLILLAVVQLNAGLDALGVYSFTDLRNDISKSFEKEQKFSTTMLSNGSQLLSITATSSGYTPEVSVVRKGVPIVWEINDLGTTGCTNGIISKSLLGNERIDLVPGKNSVNLSALSEGTYKYTCWMGMYSGFIVAK